jgi:transposase-like protein
VDRARDHQGQVIDVFISNHGDSETARRVLTAHGERIEVVTDKTPAPARVVDELVAPAIHSMNQYESNRCEADHGRFRARLRPMRDAQANMAASIVVHGPAFVQNFRRGHFERGVEVAPLFRLATAFDEPRLAI